MPNPTTRRHHHAARNHAAAAPLIAMAPRRGVAPAALPSTRHGAFRLRAGEAGRRPAPLTEALGRATLAAAGVLLAVALAIGPSLAQSGGGSGGSGTGGASGSGTGGPTGAGATGGSGLTAPDAGNPALRNPSANTPRPGLATPPDAPAVRRPDPANPASPGDIGTPHTPGMPGTGGAGDIGTPGLPGAGGGATPSDPPACATADCGTPTIMTPP
ncbi:hypothetical protein [Ancylobacter lacus]|uniref:hypothetical protein n=1 Tax=Ancylobacter lacus TaxID=2579970 RepID=UPI001BD05765|nr:hypothetical protein [Ancylobacter lacus]MBS7539595.1 hypothetical protein [Ancylobacter lacus]